MDEQVLSLVINAIDNATNVVNNVSNTITGAGDKIKNFGSNIRNVGAQLSVISAPLILFGKQSLDAAQQVEGMRVKFKGVFGDMATQVETWSSKNAQALGKSKFDLEGYASELGNVYENLGNTTQASAQMSEKTISLAEDIAAFNHVSDSQVVDSLRLAIEGNTRSMKQYGIVISNADVNQELLNMHIEGGTKHATNAELAQARLNLIMKQSSKATGEAAKVSGNWEHQTAALQNKIHDLQVEIGEKLMTILSPLIGKINEVVTWFSNLDNGTKDTIVRIGLIVAAIGPLLLIIGTVVNIIGGLVGVLGTVLSPIGLLIAAIILLKRAWDTNFGGIQEKVGAVISFLREQFEKFKVIVENIINSPAVQAFIKFVKETIGNIIKGVQKAIEEIRPRIEQLIAKFQEWDVKLRPIAEIIQQVMGVLLALAGIIIGVVIMGILKFVEILVNLAGPIISGLIDAIGGLVDWIVTAFRNIYDFVKPIIEQFVSIIQVAWSGIQEIIRVAMDIIQNLIIPIIQIIVKGFEYNFNLIRNVVESVFNFIKNNIIGPVVDWFNNNIKPRIDQFIQGLIDLFNKIKTPIESVFNGLKDTVTKVWNGIGDTIKSAINGVIDIINGFIGQVNSMLENLDKNGQGIGIKVSFRIGTIPHLAQGTDFIVPAGHNGDDYPFSANLQSGERVQITPADQVRQQQQSNFTHNNNRSVSIGQVVVNNNQDFDEFTHKLEFNLNL